MNSRLVHEERTELLPYPTSCLSSSKNVVFGELQQLQQLDAACAVSTTVSDILTCPSCSRYLRNVKCCTHSLFHKPAPRKQQGQKKQESHMEHKSSVASTCNCSLSLV